MKMNRETENKRQGVMKMNQFAPGDEGKSKKLKGLKIKETTVTRRSFSQRWVDRDMSLYDLVAPS